MSQIGEKVEIVLFLIPKKSKKFSNYNYPYSSVILNTIIVLINVLN